MTTKIEWAEETWNPTTGCDKVSPGCDNCYALDMAKRLKAMGQPKYQNDGDPRTSGPGFALTCHPDELDRPLRWRKPRTVFVNSMSDLFHPDVDPEFFIEVLKVMVPTRRHTYQILTKRPQRMAAVMDIMSRGMARLDLNASCLKAGVTVTKGGDGDHLGDHIWWGTSIESDRYTFRADHLRATPAAVRFLSLEPLLGPLPSLDLTGIDWVIVGGESGHGARPMHPDWVRDIRDRCGEQGVAYFFKQWGAWSPDPESTPDPDAMVLLDGRAVGVREQVWFAETVGAVPMACVGKKAAGRVLDGRTWDQMPERVTA